MRLRALWHDEAGVAALAALESLRRPERQRQDVKTLHLLLASLDAVAATFQERGRSEPATVNPLWPTQDRVMSFYRARSGERNAGTVSNTEAFLALAKVDPARYAPADGEGRRSGHRPRHDVGAVRTRS